MKHNAIVGNIGHFDNEIDMAGLLSWPGIVRQNIKPQVRPLHLPGRTRRHHPRRGPPAEPGLRHRPPVVRHVGSFTNQVMAQIELCTRRLGKYEKKVYTLPKHLDEKVARLHLAKLGAKLTILSDDQAAYINVDKNGPYKPAHYRY